MLQLSAVAISKRCPMDETETRATEPYMETSFVLDFKKTGLVPLLYLFSDYEEYFNNALIASCNFYF